MRGLGAAGPVALIAAGLSATVVGLQYDVWESGNPGAGLLPAVAGLGLALLAALVLATEAAPPSGDSTSLRRLLGYLLAIFGFAVFMEPAGTFVTMVAVFVWILRGVERLSWRLTLAVTAGTALGAWLLFDRLLHVPLPVGWR